MGVCPSCSKDIHYLNAFSLEENKQIVELREDGDLDWGLSEVVEDTCVRIQFECPECNQVIYENKGDSCDPNIVALLK